MQLRKGDWEMSEKAEWTGPELDDLARKIDAVEFDHVFVMDGSVLGFRHEFPSNVYAPTVEHDTMCDIRIDGVPVAESPWSALTGFTGQQSYNGAVMHSSEYIGRAIAEHMSYLSQDEPVTFVVCVVNDPADDEPAGWCVLYRENTVPDFKCLFPSN